MPFKCPHCGSWIDKYVLAGVYLHFDEDIPTIEQDGSSPMRWSGRFKPLAMLECGECGMVSFLTRQKAKVLGLEPIPSADLYPAPESEETEESEDER